MLRSNGSVAAPKVIGGTVFVASPADSFRMFRIQRQFRFRHDNTWSIKYLFRSMVRRRAIVIPILPNSAVFLSVLLVSPMPPGFDFAACRQPVL